MNPKQAVLRLAQVALASTVAAAGVQAAGAGRQPSKLLLQLDANHDGHVSRSEIACARGIERVENALKPK